MRQNVQTWYNIIKHPFMVDPGVDHYCNEMVIIAKVENYEVQVP